MLFTSLQRENFQMEGPTGVRKQLQSLWHILELTDREMFAHLTHIGAETLHFASECCWYSFVGNYLLIRLFLCGSYVLNGCSL